MNNLITFGGQHQGVYGIPQCLGEYHVVCDYVRRLLNLGAYKSWIQNFLVQSSGLLTVVHRYQLIKIPN